jgi:2-polyprenyl-3-methyl-5-hydroxy-6-metoxy-1,4-benzoquinol methylase
LFEETIAYSITRQLVVRLIELRNVPPDFSRCPYCGSTDLWHLLWPASLALSQQLAQAFPASYWQGKQVLVIGCGVGLESVTLAKLGAQVTALDHIPAALRLVQRSCQQNALPPVRTLCKCWLDSRSVRQLGQYEVLIGSDVLYESADAVSLQELLTVALKPGGMALFADPQRESAKAFLRRLASSGFQVQVQRSQTQWIPERQEVRIYHINHQGRT